MLGHEHERLLLITGFLQPLKREINDDIGRVSGMLPLSRRSVRLPVFHGRVIVWALSDQDFIVVETCWGGLQMPFAKHCGRIPSLTKDLGKSLLCSVKGIPVTNESIQVTVLASQYHRSARTTDRIGDVTTIETHSPICNPIHVRSGNPGRVVGAESLLTMIIRENQQNIRSLCAPQRHAAEQEKQAQSHHRIRTPVPTRKVKGQIDPAPIYRSTRLTS